MIPSFDQQFLDQRFEDNASKYDYNKTPISKNIKKVILITGCGSGIGMSLTKILSARKDYRIVATARPLALKNLYAEGLKDSENLMIRPLDVISSNSRRVLIKEIESLWGGIDVLVNNAAISFRSCIEDMDCGEEEIQMATNYFGPLGLIREILPSMRAKHSGQIINISSVGGMMAMPTMGSYSASKFALEGASEALWYELKPWGISVSLIQPGFLNSNAFKKVYLSKKARSISDYDIYYKSMGKFIEKLMRMSFSTPETVAKKIIYYIDSGNGPLRIAGTIDAYLFTFLRRMLPQRIYHYLLFHCLPERNLWVSKNQQLEKSTYNIDSAKLKTNSNSENRHQETQQKVSNLL